jgi:hypothetical protein
MTWKDDEDARLEDARAERSGWAVRRVMGVGEVMSTDGRRCEEGGF